MASARLDVVSAAHEIEADNGDVVQQLRHSQ
jgi:hypothetical protein